jgi:hypothetical protein
MNDWPVSRTVSDWNVEYRMKRRKLRTHGGCRLTYLVKLKSGKVPTISFSKPCRRHYLEISKTIPARMTFAVHYVQNYYMDTDSEIRRIKGVDNFENKFAFQAAPNKSHQCILVNIEAELRT